MSYDISLQNEKGEIAKVKRFQEGGTYQMGGSDVAELNVTYNYSEIFSIKKELDGKSGAGTLSLLKSKVAELGTNRYKDYWAPTHGNVGYMLEILRRWAEQYPDYTWRVS